MSGRRDDLRTDRIHDRIIDGHIAGTGADSALIDTGRLDEIAAAESFGLNYPEALSYAEKKIEALLKKGGADLRINRVDNPDDDSGLFDTVNGKVPKFTYQLGRAEDPEFNILFITGTHGEESRLWRAGLEVLLQLAEEGGGRTGLLERGQITFDIFGDIIGFDNQSRGFVDRSGVQVNEPLVTGRKHDRNPFGLGDRNGEQGRKLAGIAQPADEGEP